MKKSIKIICSWKGCLFSVSAILVLSLYLLPHVFYHFDAPNPSWMALTGPNDQEYFLTLVEEVYRGSPNLISPFLGGYEEIKGSPLLPFPIYLMGWFQRILHLSPKSLVLVLDIVIPLAVFYLIFALGRRIGLGFKSSILASFISVSAPLLFVAGPLSQLLIFTLPGRDLLVSPFLPLSRILNPQIGILFFIGALVLWVDFRRALWPTIGCLALSALCMASNFFLGNALLAFWSSQLLIELLLRRKFKDITLLLVTFAATLTPLILQWRELANLGKIFLNIFLLNIQESRLPLVTMGEGVAIFLLLLHLLLRRASFYESCRDRFLVTSMTAYLVSMNQQIITGKIVQSWHYEYYVFNLLLPIAVVVVIAEWMESNLFSVIGRFFDRKKISAFFFFAGLIILAMGLFGRDRIYPFAPNGVKEVSGFFEVFCVVAGGFCLLSGCITLFNQKVSIKPGILLIVMLMAFSFADGMTVQLAGYGKIKDRQIMFESEYKAPFQWINSNLTSSNIFFGWPFELGAMDSILIYTRQKVFLSKYSTVHPIPGLDEYRKRMLIVFALMRMSENEFTERVINGKEVMRWLYFRKYYHKISWQTTLTDWNRFPPLTDQDILNAYYQYFSYMNYSIEELFRMAKADYIYWGPLEKQNFRSIDPSKLEFLEKVFSDNNVEIYRVRH